MKPLHIVILDDSCIICEGLQALLSRSKYVRQVTTVSSFGELENQMKRWSCPLVILNPALVQASLAQYSQLRSQCECVRWIGMVYAHFPSDLLSRFDGTIDVFDHRETIDVKLMKWVEANEEDNASPGRDMLTERETDVLKLLAEGKSNKEIADSLNISINTVITHRKNISQKTGIKSVSGLTIYAVVQNLISLENY